MIRRRTTTTKLELMRKKMNVEKEKELYKAKE